MGNEWSRMLYKKRGWQRENLETQMEHLASFY
jgi:hypothetical protein